MPRDRSPGLPRNPPPEGASRAALAAAFADRLGGFSVVLEIVPPHRRVGAKGTERFLERIRAAVDELPKLDALNIPEVVDENRVGRPYYRHIDPRRFASALNNGLHVETIVNKVVVHLQDVDQLRAYLAESLDAYGLRNFVLAGGSSGRHAYSGPDVITANEILRGLARGRTDVTCGNILIPDRPGEVDRLLRKTRAGCRFFTTQVLFQAEPIASVLRAYGEACAVAGVRPASVLLSFTPVTDRADVELLGWLGAAIPRDVEAALLSRDDGERSVELARSVWCQIRDYVEAAEHPVPLGVNVEEISAHNFDFAVRMAQEAPSWRDAASA